MTEWRWEPYFYVKEFECKHCKKLVVDSAFMDKLRAIRVVFDKPMVITSGYRCPIYNKLVSNTGIYGPHTIAAADIHIFGKDALELIELALKFGMTGIGVKQRGIKSSRFVHLDMLNSSNFPHGPRPWIWSY